MSGLTIRNVIKRYGDVQVMHGVDLDIGDGEFCVFVGPSGCGKSTLLRMIAGLEDITEGSVSIGSRDVTRMDPGERGVAMVFQTEMRVEIARLHKEIGATMVYVTHDQVEAMTLADKIVVLRLGRIEQVGAPLDFYRDPDNKFVAGFIGSPAMNFLDGVVVDGGEIAVPGLQASVSVPVRLPGEGTDVSVGLRPEHLVIDPKGDTHVVEMTEALGGVSYAYLMSETGEKIIVEERGDVRSEEGARVGLVLDLARAMVFDATSEARIR